MNSSRPSRPQIKAYTDVLTFGKYKGHTVEWVLDNHPSYIVWLEEEGVAVVDQKIYNEAQELDYKEYDDWLGVDPYDWCD